MAMAKRDDLPDVSGAFFLAFGICLPIYREPGGAVA
jgi:hypothetical protein